MRLKFSLAVSMFIVSFIPSIATAQATRTWVSGVGDDANPCSRTAPCKTFAGAIAKTAAGGEINAIDPGGYGAVTITKAITIDGAGTVASILASATVGINIAAGVNDVVTIRNLSINGAGTTLGTRGIRFQSGKALVIEYCTIANFGDRGISIETPESSMVFIRDTSISRTNNIGIAVLPSSGAPTIKVMLERVSSIGNAAHGLFVSQGGRVSAFHSVFSNNTNVGVFVEEPSNTTEVFLENTAVSGNATGIQIGGGAPQVFISNVLVANNLSAGLVPGLGAIISFGQNRLAGNGTATGPTQTLPQQ